MLENEIEALDQLICQAKAPVLLAGMGTVAASAELYALAAAYPHLRIATTPRAKGVFPEGHPQGLGVDGFCGSPAAARFIAGAADVLLAFGTRLGETSGSGWKTKTPGIPIVRVDVKLAGVRRLPSTVLQIEADARAVMGWYPKATGSQRCHRSSNASSLLCSWATEESVTARRHGVTWQLHRGG